MVEEDALARLARYEPEDALAIGRAIAEWNEVHPNLRITTGSCGDDFCRGTFSLMIHVDLYDFIHLRIEDLTGDAVAKRIADRVASSPLLAAIASVPIRDESMKRYDLV